MAQQLKGLTALPEVLSSISSNYMVAHNYLQSRLITSYGIPEDGYSMNLKKKGEYLSQDFREGINIIKVCFKKLSKTNKNKQMQEKYTHILI